LGNRILDKPTIQQSLDGFREHREEGARPQGRATTAVRKNPTTSKGLGSMTSNPPELPEPEKNTACRCPRTQKEYGSLNHYNPNIEKRARSIKGAKSGYTPREEAWSGTEYGRRLNRGQLHKREGSPSKNASGTKNLREGPAKQSRPNSGSRS